MKPFYTTLLILVLLTSCSRGYYSHLPRTKTTAKHPIEHREDKDTIPYTILSGLISDSVENHIPIEIQYVEEEEYAFDTASDIRDTVSYNDYTKDVYKSGIKRIKTWIFPAFISDVVLTGTSNIVAEVIALALNAILISGIVFLFVAAIFWLKRNKKKKYIENADTKFGFDGHLQGLFIGIILNILLVGEAAYNTFGWFAAWWAEGAMFLFAAIAVILTAILLYYLYARSYNKRHKISSNKKNDPNKKPKKIRLDLLKQILIIAAMTTLPLLSYIWDEGSSWALASEFAGIFFIYIIFIIYIILIMLFLAAFWDVFDGQNLKLPEEE